MIEKEAIAAAAGEYGVAIEPGDARRNIVVEGVALNHLVGREFNLGEVRVRGIRLCEPCRYLESLTKPGLRRALIHRGGLRAEILVGGVIRTGDSVAG
jgi:MOSC domain-containing protein YiiM